MSVRTRLALSGSVVALAALVVSVLVWLPAEHAAAAGPPGGLHVSGNRLLDSSGASVVLHGVDRSGSEYACIQGFGFFDGPTDAPSIAAMAAWHINAVRVPLNEDCWLGINDAPSAYSGSAYQSAIEGYVTRLHAAGLVAILDLHWTAAGTSQSTGQQDMPDADHAPAFWTSVAAAFKTDSSAVFDLFNEPHDVSWSCWRDGGDCGIGYQVAGMQTLVSTVRATGATNPVLVGGLAYANDLSSWLAYRPSDPTGNLLASWHSYNFNACASSSCWDGQIAPVAAAVPLVAGEVGENDCAHGYLDSLLPWLDGHGAGYLGWGWDTFDCSSFPALISDYSGTPTNFGVGLRDHLTALAAGTGPTSSIPTATAPTTTAPTTTAPSSTVPSSTVPTTTAPSSTVPTTTVATTTVATTTVATTTVATTTVATTTVPSSPSGGPATLTATPSSLTSSAPWWWEEDLDLSPSAPITSLTITVRVARTTGISYSGFYTSAPGGALKLRETTGPTALVYLAGLNAGQTLAAGGTFRLGAQFGGNGTPHAVAGDTFRVQATVGGRAVTVSGHF